MSEDFKDNKVIQAQSSETISNGSGGSAPDLDYVRPVSYTHLRAHETDS